MGQWQIAPLPTVPCVLRWQFVGGFFLFGWGDWRDLPATHDANDENTLFFPTPRAYLPIAFSPHDAMGVLSAPVYYKRN